MSQLAGRWQPRFFATTDVEAHALHSKFEISAIPLYPERVISPSLCRAKYFFCISIPSAWSFLSFFCVGTPGFLIVLRWTVAGFFVLFCAYKAFRIVYGSLLLSYGIKTNRWTDKTSWKQIIRFT